MRGDTTGSPSRTARFCFCGCSDTKGTHQAGNGTSQCISRNSFSFMSLFFKSIENVYNYFCAVCRFRDRCRNWNKIMFPMENIVSDDGECALPAGRALCVQAKRTHSRRVIRREGIQNLPFCRERMADDDESISIRLFNRSPALKTRRQYSDLLFRFSTNSALRVWISLSVDVFKISGTIRNKSCLFQHLQYCNCNIE